MEGDIYWVIGLVVIRVQGPRYHTEADSLAQTLADISTSECATLKLKGLVFLGGYSLLRVMPP